jgi:stage V sporulation protein SpoVS
MPNPILKYSGKPKRHSWARWLNIQTMRKNDNNLISVIGATGSGKTYAAMSIAEIMTEISGVDFGIGNIVFSFPELMRLINGGTLKRGSIIIFDEPQASIGSREFQSLSNKVFNLLVSTFRSRNFSLFFCMPSETLLDKQTRMLFKQRFQTLSINRNNNTCRLDARCIEYSTTTNKCYTKFMRIFFNQDGTRRREKIMYWDVPLPSKELIELYEEKKRQFTDNLNLNIQKAIEDFDKSGKSMTADYREPEPPKRKPLTETQERVMRAIANTNNYAEATEILGITAGAISHNKALSLKKGYSVEEFKEAVVEKVEI